VGLSAEASNDCLPIGSLSTSVKVEGSRFGHDDWRSARPGKIGRAVGEALLEEDDELIFLLPETRNVCLGPGGRTGEQGEQCQDTSTRLLTT